MRCLDARVVSKRGQVSPVLVDPSSQLGHVRAVVVLEREARADYGQEAAALGPHVLVAVARPQRLEPGLAVAEEVDAAPISPQFIIPSSKRSTNAAKSPLLGGGRKKKGDELDDLRLE